MASGLGLADTEVFGMEATDTSDELLDMADGVLETGNMVASPFNFSGPGRRECWRIGRVKSPSGSGVEMAMVVMMDEKAISLVSLGDWDPTWLQGERAV
jgi:hypothetical protein